LVLLLKGVGRRVGGWGRGGGGISFDGGGGAGTEFNPFGFEDVGADSGAERDSAGTALLGVAAEALGVDCPSSAGSERGESGAVC
jgi:hypothetical protein